MGFQSDIYLGFAGKNEVVAAVGEERYNSLLPDPLREREEDEHYVG